MTAERSRRLPVLLVDDEEEFLRSAGISLRVAGFEVVATLKGGDAPGLLSAQRFGAVVLDIMMPDLSGAELLPKIVQLAPGTPVIMLTAVNDVDTAVSCMQAGAFDYLVKPVEKERLVTSLKRALEHVDLFEENRRLREYLLGDTLHQAAAFDGIVTRSKRMVAIFQYIEAVAQSPMPVLIQGETGVGKELVARAVHAASGCAGQFVVVNAAGLSDALFCDTLFGHRKGAFTGADTNREGLVATAAGGTLFLDEIGDLAVESQVKLLRLVEDRTYYPVGADATRRCEARIVVATNKDLATLRGGGAFRQDLYYRLQSHEIRIPPLRERKEDIALLVDAFLEQAVEQLKKPGLTVSPDVYSLLERYAFPGNVRELKNMVFDAASVAASSPLTPSAFEGKLAHRDMSDEASGPSRPLDSLTENTLSRMQTLPNLKDAEQMLIDEALRRADGNQTRAAQLLGMTRSALNKRLTRARE